ncbi:MAG TPA: SDR family oxidoreductase, partial [Myxococcota bacterium]|nr:SDR family oxidoreductase [Myxococcota bacterium]
MGAFDWTNKVVLVTGGTRGIGLETALCFARAGARPVITYRWGGSEEAALARFSAEALPQPRLLRADVSRESDTQRLMTELKADCDGIDAFLSNVSVASMVKGMEDYKLRALQRSIECTSWPMVAYTQ